MSSDVGTTLSPDGQYRWDGQAWQPNVPPPSPQVNIAPSRHAARRTSRRQAQPVVVAVVVVVVGLAAAAIYVMQSRNATKSAAEPAVPATSTATSTFLAKARAIDPADLAGDTDADVISFGNSVCKSMTDGLTVTTIGVHLATTDGISGINAGSLVGAAVAYLCPQFDSVALAETGNGG